MKWAVLFLDGPAKGDLHAWKDRPPEEINVPQLLPGPISAKSLDDQELTSLPMQVLVYKRFWEGDSAFEPFSLSLYRLKEIK